MIMHSSNLLISHKKSSSSDIPNLLDFGKGLGIIGVFLMHYQLLGFGWQGVHLFIVFSGFGLTYSCLKRNSNLSWKLWYFKRLRRILPTYLLVALCGYFVVTFFIMLQGNNLFQALWLSKRTLLFDVTLLKNFNYEQMSTFPNVSLWFVPFIISFYFIFPILYRWIIQHRTIKHALTVLTVMIFAEFAYRAIAIYWLDGIPVAYYNIKDLFLKISLPLNRIPDSIDFPFQLAAPFGFFPSRVGEFALGMAAAISYVLNQKKLNRAVLAPKAGLIGFLIWLVANALIDAGFIGWVIGDFLVAVGLTLWVLSLAAMFANKAPKLFAQISQVGVFSYYIFLIHAVFIQAFIVFVTGYIKDGFLLWKSPIINLVVLVGLIILTAIASKLLQQFDNSKFVNQMIQQSLGRILKEE